MQADGRGGGQARRFDARAVDELLRALGLANDEFVVILMRAQTREARDGLADGEVLDRCARFFDEVVQTLGGGVRTLTVVDVDGRRADNGVAVDRRADQHALAELAGQLEDGMRDEIAGILVQQAVIAAPRRDVQLARRDHVVQHVRIDARRVDHVPRFKIAVVRVDGPEAVLPGKAGDFGVELEFHAVVERILCQRDRQIERADDAAGRGPERGDRVLRHVRLQLVQALRVHDLQLLDAVFHAVFIQRPQLRQILLGHADDERAVHFERKIQILRQLRHHKIALEVHFRHQTAVRGVEARVDDGAVGLGGAAAHVLRLFQHQHPALVARQIPRDCAAGHTGADDDNVVQKDSSFSAKECRAAQESLPVGGLDCPTRSLRAENIQICLPGNDVVEQDSDDTADDRPEDRHDQAVFEVARALALDGENGVRDTRAKVTRRVQRIAGQTAEGHADGHDDAEDQQLADTGSQLRDLIQTADGEDQHEGRDGFLHDVAAGIGNGRTSGEDAELRARIFRCIEMIFEEDVDENAADDTAEDLCDDVAGNQRPVKHAADRQCDGQRRVEACAGGFAEDKRGDHDRKAPGNGDLDGACALHAGLVEGHVCNDAVAEKDQHHCAKELT